MMYDRDKGTDLHVTNLSGLQYLIFTYLNHSVSSYFVFEI